MTTDRGIGGKVAVITGGSGGLGSAIAQRLLEDGAAVFLTARRAEVLEATRARLLAAVPGGEVAVLAGDAESPEHVQAVLERAHGLRGHLDIIVSTVGQGLMRPLLMHDIHSFREELDRNIITAFLAIRYGAPLMTAGGSIVCISSTVGTRPMAWMSSYATAKGGLENLVRAAAEELGGAGIRVNAVRPGLTRTDGVAAVFADPVLLGTVMREVPLNRGGEPPDIAAAVRYLAGPDSSWVTGQMIGVDGGLDLRKNPDLSDAIGLIYGQAALEAVKRGKAP